jgi:putative transposon-encoded protein
MEIKTEAYQVIEKTVNPGGNSGRVYVPKSWIGKKVTILLMEPLDSE